MKQKKPLLAVSILTIFLGVLVMIGWFLNIAVFKSVIPGYVSMKINTAICFIIAGIIFNLLLRGRYHPLYFILSAVLLLFGLVLPHRIFFTWTWGSMSFS